MSSAASVAHALAETQKLAAGTPILISGPEIIINGSGPGIGHMPESGPNSGPDFWQCTYFMMM